MAESNRSRRRAATGQSGTGDDLPTSAVAVDAPTSVPVSTLVPIEDHAWQLHLRGYSYRDIARQLKLDKDTVNAYVKRIAKETAPARREKRQEWLRQAVSRLQNVQAHAWDYFDRSSDISALNTITNAEKEIARLRGLYDTATEDAGAGGVLITISRRGAVSVTATGQGGTPDE